MRVRAPALIATALLTASCTIGPIDADRGPYPAKNISILAPGSTGGGWDTRARAIDTALGDCDVTDRAVTVENVPGAGGTIGLAQFVANAGDPHELMVMDTLTMLGGIVRNDSPVNLTELTPIAGLTTSKGVIVVPAASPHRTLAELIAGFRADPRGTSWVGGSLGGPDHLLVGLLADENGIAADQLNYVATGGGGEMLTLLVSGSAKAGVGTANELRAQIEAGELRALAVTGGDRLAGIDAPSLKELGLSQVDLASVGGVLAPPGLDRSKQREVIDLIARMRSTPCWPEQVARNDWTDAWLPGDEFAAKIAQHEQQVTRVLEELGMTP
ncbi:tripartite tricarboxylate transporter substrate binding protein [Saccharopolyspora erythraea]|uniref:Bug family tripartite tricarboxylate transporter substrate binding protein n=1 Tax=Saccharopolyspora erythraea TaxID=1836 RepID=UPI001BAE3D95|nr:tripartite tricarboxylate transporter substrate binding protein [Saccharopolyspora erythraea]QUH02005.1 tripartite tricarboxylate transporter substrate binding protein [Saccharopolyspora erythraea]